VAVAALVVVDDTLVVVEGAAVAFLLVADAAVLAGIAVAAEVGNPAVVESPAAEEALAGVDAVADIVVAVDNLAAELAVAVARDIHRLEELAGTAVAAAEDLLDVVAAAAAVVVPVDTVLVAVEGVAAAAAHLDSLPYYPQDFGEVVIQQQLGRQPAFPVLVFWRPRPWVALAMVADLAAAAAQVEGPYDWPWPKNLFLSWVCWQSGPKGLWVVQPELEPPEPGREAAFERPWH
jgi:hypothetical protein